MTLVSAEYKVSQCTMSLIGFNAHSEGFENTYCCFSLKVVTCGRNGRLVGSLPIAESAGQSDSILVGLQLSCAGPKENS